MGQFQVGRWGSRKCFEKQHWFHNQYYNGFWGGGDHAVWSNKFIHKYTIYICTLGYLGWPLSPLSFISTLSAAPLERKKVVGALKRKKESNKETKTLPVLCTGLIGKRISSGAYWATDRTELYNLTTPSWVKCKPYFLSFFWCPLYLGWMYSAGF